MGSYAPDWPSQAAMAGFLSLPVGWCSGALLGPWMMWLCIAQDGNMGCAAWIIVVTCLNLKSWLDGRFFSLLLAMGTLVCCAQSVGTPTKLSAHVRSKLLVLELLMLNEKMKK